MKETNTAASDEELAVRARQGDAAAETLLLEKYKPLVRSRARELFLAGGDREDLIQEGMLGLLKAVRSYDPKREASFGTYARVVVSRQIYSALAAAQRQKHQALNQSVSMEEIEEQQDRLALGTSDSPEAILLDLQNGFQVVIPGLVAESSQVHDLLSFFVLFSPLFGNSSDSRPHSRSSAAILCASTRSGPPV